MELRTIQSESDFLSPASCGRISWKSCSSPSGRCGCSKSCPLSQENLQSCFVPINPSTVSSEATAERLLSSITTKDFRGQEGLYVQVIWTDHSLTAGIVHDGMRQQFEFRQHQWDLDRQSHQSGRFASL